MILDTERLILRPWEDADAPRLYELAKDPDIGHRAGWPAHTGVENSLDIIRGPLGAPETYAMVLRESGLPAGSIGLKEPDERFAAADGPQLEIGYWIGRAYWGCGLTPEAAARILRRAFDELHCAAVWCAHYDYNLQSRRVIEKSGFRYQCTKDTTNLLGITNKTLFYAITREEWTAR